MPCPRSHLRGLDLSRLLAAAWATQIPVAMGARLITVKVLAEPGLIAEDFAAPCGKEVT